MLGNEFHLTCLFIEQVNLSQVSITRQIHPTRKQGDYTSPCHKNLNWALVFRWSLLGLWELQCTACVPLNKTATCRSLIHQLLTEEGKTHCFKVLLFLKLKSSYKKLCFEIGRENFKKLNRAEGKFSSVCQSTQQKRSALFVGVLLFGFL